MAVTLQEYMRSVVQQDPQLAGVVKVFMHNAPVLGEGLDLGYPLPALKFENVVGGTASFVRQRTLPTTGVRQLNVEFTASTGETEKLTESLVLTGGLVNIDRALISRGGEAGLITQIEMQIASHARLWNNMFYHGDTSANEFAGLDKRITGDQLIDNGGGALDLTLLDKALLNVRGDNLVIVMGTGLASRLFRACKIATNVNYTPQTFGVSPATYNGVPIMLAGETATETDVLGFTETGNSTSLYVLSLGETGVVGVQTQPIQIIYPSERQAVDSSYKVEWDVSFIIKNKRAAYRIRNIADKAISVSDDGGLLEE